MQRNVNRKLIENGLKFNNLVIVQEIPTAKYTSRKFLCQCICGNKKIIRWGHLQNGHTKSYRKDSNVGYLKTNVVVCCSRCNRGKNNIFSYEEWVKIGKVIKTFTDNLQ